MPERLHSRRRVAPLQSSDAERRHRQLVSARLPWPDLGEGGREGGVIATHGVRAPTAVGGRVIDIGPHGDLGIDDGWLPLQAADFDAIAARLPATFPPSRPPSQRSRPGQLGRTPEPSENVRIRRGKNHHHTPPLYGEGCGGGFDAERRDPFVFGATALVGLGGRTREGRMTLRERTRYSPLTLGGLCVESEARPARLPVSRLTCGFAPCRTLPRHRTRPCAFAGVR